jgi:hypothetical protein
MFHIISLFLQFDGLRPGREPVGTPRPLGVFASGELEQRARRDVLRTARRRAGARSPVALRAVMLVP